MTAGQSSRRAFAWFALPLVSAALALLVVRWRIGFQFPVPWPDETSFISPAFTMARSGSLFDPSLNPDRLTMWMPPGYSLFLAVFFRLFGYGFGLARWLSAACVLGSLGLIARLAWTRLSGRDRTLASWAAGAAFASPYVLISGNIARMEALFCLMILAALSFGLAGRAYVMAALVASAAIVHFNAVYFVPAVAAEFGARLMRRQPLRPGVGGWIAMQIAFLCLLSYAALVAFNWNGFVTDMRVQFNGKAFAGLDDPAHPAWMPLAAAALVLANAALLRGPRALSDQTGSPVGLKCSLKLRTRAFSGLLTRFDQVGKCSGRTLLPALFGAGFVVMAHYGHELWYDYGQPLGFALIALSLLGVPEAGSPAARGAARLGACAAIGMVLIVGFRITPFLRPLLPRPAMLVHPFLPPSEIARIRGFIATLHPGDTLLFGWTGVENFFLADLAKVGAHWVLMQHSVTQTLPLRAADWNIDCESSTLFPRQRMYDFAFPPNGADGACRIVPVSLAARRR